MNIKKAALIVVWLLTIAVVSFWIGWHYSNDQIASFQKMLGDVSPISDCIVGQDQKDGRKEYDSTAQRLKYELCYSVIVGQGQVNDFRMRRLKFLQQAYDERILLWTVVIITLSGVGLAALQLGASYTLASAAKLGTLGDLGGDLSLEKTKISLKSSVTGLLILVISFAFFLVFVLFVYKIEEVKIDPKESAVPQQSKPEGGKNGYN